MSEEDSDPTYFFTDQRGITEDIWRARPYSWWKREDPEPATTPFADLAQGQRRHVARIAAQSAGWVIHRHAPPLWPPLPHIYPELRPIDPVKTDGPHWHWHGDGPEPAGLKPWHRLEGKERDSHIGRGKSDDHHRGTNTEEFHSHQDMAKYVFAPSPSVSEEYEHDHATGWRRRSAQDRPHYREAHIAKQHGGIDQLGSHRHQGQKKDKTTPLARRLDVHPMAVPLLEEAEVVFFVIEGCIKADAVLSDGGAVFSVPSVSLWDCEELERFAMRYLEGRVVVIVPDADWDKNPAVVTQARLCQNRLLRTVVKDVHIAAPPSRYMLKGVDDFLGAGHHLEQLQVIDYDQAEGLTDFVMQKCWSYRRDRTRRDAEVLNGLANFTGPDGILKAPLRMVANVMAVDVKRVARAVYDLKQMGALTIDGNLAARQDHFSRRLEWTDRPTIQLAPGLRAKKRPEQPLGDVVPSLILRPPN